MLPRKHGILFNYNEEKNLITLNDFPFFHKPPNNKSTTTPLTSITIPFIKMARILFAFPYHPKTRIICFSLGNLHKLIQSITLENI
jgi:hypothetical protein